MRRGFLTMAKARQSMGRGALSALDCREKMIAQMTVEKDEGADLPVTVDTLESSTLWHRHRIGDEATDIKEDIVCGILQYPGTLGDITDPSKAISITHKNSGKAALVCA